MTTTDTNQPITFVLLIIGGLLAVYYLTDDYPNADGESM